LYSRITQNKLQIIYWTSNWRSKEINHGQLAILILICKMYDNVFFLKSPLLVFCMKLISSSSKEIKNLRVRRHHRWVWEEISCPFVDISHLVWTIIVEVKMNKNRRLTYRAWEIRIPNEILLLPTLTYPTILNCTKFSFLDFLDGLKYSKRNVSFPPKDKVFLVLVNYLRHVN